MRSFYKVIVFVIIIGIGLAIAMGFIKTKPEAKRRPVSIAAPLVEFVEVYPQSVQIIIEANGTVIPSKEVLLQPQISGVVVWQSPKLVPGSIVKQGETLVRIDPRDYELAVEQQKVTLTRARLELETEQGRAEVARLEWDLLSDDVEYTESGRELALRKPQLANAEAGILAAESALAKAELNLERTVIKAPFNAVILSEHVDVGQYLSPGMIIATLAGSDMFRVQASLNQEELAWIDVPGIHGGNGSSVRIIQREGADMYNHAGEVESLLIDVDEKGRMARLLISVPDPFGKVPLLLGAYVNVEIAGTTVDDVYVILPEALREGDRVWLLGSENRLDIRNIEVIRRQRNGILVRGLSEKDLVITSRISSPVSGMELRINKDNRTPRSS
ncbi:MAG: efflux RND transporter periplasmic adaptor subunit [Deltaproteobacteria bacterium]|nr:efflux RND transporter periplasmic adaptor subunit [Deltaproteobacteria bacterium]